MHLHVCSLPQAEGELEIGVQLPSWAPGPPGPHPSTAQHSTALAPGLCRSAASNMRPGHHGGGSLLLFSSIASSNDNSTIHLLVKHLK